MNHPWFDSFNWKLLDERIMQSPYVPDIKVDNFDAKHVNNLEWKDAEAVKEKEVLLRKDSIQELFRGYYYNKNDLNSGPKVNPDSRQSVKYTHTTTGGGESMIKGNNSKLIGEEEVISEENVRD